jgi:hypothetical protein
VCNSHSHKCGTSSCIARLSFSFEKCLSVYTFQIQRCYAEFHFPILLLLGGCHRRIVLGFFLGLLFLLLTLRSEGIPNVLPSIVPGDIFCGRILISLFLPLVMSSFKTPIICGLSIRYCSHTSLQKAHQSTLVCVECCPNFAS